MRGPKYPEHAQPEKSDDTGEEQVPAGSLVPLYTSPIVPGIQAFRRGDIILYTIRGEPAQVLDLIGQLDKDGVDEVVALISHQTQPQEPPAGQEKREKQD